MPSRSNISYIEKVFSAVCQIAVIALTAAPLSAESGPKWIDSDRLFNLGAVAILALISLVLIVRSRKGSVTRIRPIKGLIAIEDAVGRAAEMGRPILYTPGLGSVGEPATVASMAILSEVARRAARLRTRIKVPNYCPLTWPVAQTVVEEAYIKADRAESYDPDDVPYLTSRNMTYATAVAGMMVRERTASNFLIGHFYSESLILAETGAAAGALQIGGTDSETQLPFFITTCDYTLIGEEIFAAGAMIGEDQTSRSTIAAHDWFKAGIIALLVAGLMLGVMGAFGFGWADDIASGLSQVMGSRTR